MDEMMQAGRKEHPKYKNTHNKIMVSCKTFYILGSRIDNVGCCGVGDGIWSSWRRWWQRMMMMMMRGMRGRARVVVIIISCITVAKKNVTFFTVDANRTKHGWPAMVLNSSDGIATFGA